jgi:hypothetical protein
MQRVLGYGAAASGLALLPAAVMIGTISLGFSARLGTRFGARAVLLAGLNLIVAALTLLARAPVHSSYLVHQRRLPPGVRRGGRPHRRGRHPGSHRAAAQRRRLAASPG